MGLWTEKARSWRKAKKRAVSPIIATILLVAITVVLAAVLYILISGLTKGPGNTPLGTAFGWGGTSNISATTTPGCAAARECYSLEVGSASSGLTPNGMTFTVRSASGAVITFSTWKFDLVTVAGAYANANWTGANSCAGTGCNSLLSPGETIVLNSGALGATSSLLGDNIIAVGQGSFQGEVATTGGLPA
jgi:flagellin-like protein